MKKYLLFAVSAMFAANVCAQELKDITPEAFDFSKKEVGLLEPDGVYHGANIQDPATGAIPFSTLFETHGRRALFILGGGQYHNPENHYAENLLAGMAIVDLGGDVGKVLAISGCESGINAKMKALFPSWDGEIPLAKGEFGWCNLNWTTDPDNTPLSEDADAYNIRCRVVLNIFSNEFSESEDYTGSIYCSTASRDMKPAGANSNNPAIKSGEFIERYADDGSPVEDEDGNPIWEPNKWMVYEFDTNVSAEAGIPTRIKWETKYPAPMKVGTLFIKEVKFFKNPEPVNAVDAVARKSFVEFEVDPTTASVNNIEAETAAQKKVYTVSGIEVGSKAQKGVYVEKIGNKTRKVVVR